MDKTQTSDSLLGDLERSVPGLRVSSLLTDRLASARDLWPRELIRVQEGRPVGTLPVGVVWPGSADELLELVRWSAAHRVALTPFGGGSGVCGGIAAIASGLVVDLKRLDRVVWTRPEDNLVRAQAGIIGWHLEEHLNRHGLTLGHFPSSLMCSTLGGYLATRSAGQCSTLYGKIEDMAVSLEVITGQGQRFETGRDSGAGPGPGWTQLFIGCEGTLGFITEATLRVQRAPAHRLMRGYRFRRVASGCEAIRRVMQSGLRPAVVRLYDEFDTVIARSGPERGSEADTLIGQVLGRVPSQAFLPWIKRQALQFLLSRPELANRLVEEVTPRLSSEGCLCVMGYEGEPDLTEIQFKLGQEEMLRSGGEDLGADPGWHWFKHRYSVSFRQSRVFTSLAFADTMEVAATWDRLMPLYEGVRKAIAPHAFVMAHFSHAYPEGCSIYFTFVGRASDGDSARETYDRLWRQALAAATRAGGTISHHHGVGRAKAGFMTEEHGTSLQLLRALKAALDPESILNPGVLGLS